jgi:hypothetical protein
MKLSTAINKSRSVYTPAGVTVISKAIARVSVNEFLTNTMNEDGHFTDDYDGTVGWYDQDANVLYLS